MPPDPAAVDLFGGPGGWDVAARGLGLDPLGVELDPAACATREAAGLRTLRGDVAELDPASFECDLLIASPPCPTFSAAGRGAGHEVVDVIVACGRAMMAGRDGRALAREEAYAALAQGAAEDELEAARRKGRPPDLDRARRRARRDAEMSLLVLEPLRWALALRPRLVALEQVPLVLPIWLAVADWLRQLGYHAWAGVLNAADYGVPQTRERAILLASLAGPVHPPAPSHCRGGALTLDGELLPWVSMAAALGWGASERVGWPRRNDTPSNKPSDGDEGEYRERDLQPAGEPALDLTGKARSWRREAEADPDEPAPALCGHHTPRWAYRNGNQKNAAIRAADEPAPTLHFGNAHNQVEWVVRTGANSMKHSRDPAEAVPWGDWPLERPATTLQGDARVFSPGGHVANDGRDNSTQIGRSEHAVRVSVAEASILQGFDPAYPWQGSRTKQFQQLGNAVPPPFARAILAALLEAAP